MLATIPIITAVVFAIMEVLKTSIKKDKFNNFIPLISCFLGGVLGVIAFFIAPEFIETQNAFMAFVMGLFSGLVATGSNQIVKQMISFSKNKKMLKDLTTVKQAEVDEKGNSKTVEVKKEIISTQETIKIQSQTESEKNSENIDSIVLDE